MSNVLYRIVSFIADGSPRASVPKLHYPPSSWAFLWLFFSLFTFHFSLSTSAQDTVRRLEEVEVSAQRTPVTIRTVAPTQVMDAAKIEQQGAIQLSDAVKQMAGVVLKDYGGVGGMKTVSARGLGSQFSTVTIDGVAVDNSQNGQVDLGRFLTGNAAYVSLSQGQVQQPLLSARAYAAGNVLNLETAEPQFHYGERTNLKLGMELGSFGLMNPTARWEQKWGKRLRTSLWSSFLKSDGNYPFTLYRQGKTIEETRQHSAMNMFITDGDLFYTIAKGNSLTAKIHYMRGMHELPGEVVLYNPMPSAQVTHEEALFAQAKWKVEREKWKTQVLGKVQRSYDRYEDSAALGYRDNYMENHYLQYEGYLSGSAVWSPLGWLDLSASADGDLSHLQSNLAYRSDVLRSSLLAVAAAHMHYKHWEADAHLLGTAVKDRVNDLDTTPSYRCLSPYAALLWSPNMHLTFRYFYKETYRVPNFSELYFFLSTPRNLRPERAMQHNVGVTWVNSHLSATLDGYFNRVVDKIVAKPGSNMYYWTMENLGLVHILGVDATLSGQWAAVSGQLNYSFAHAVDMSDPTDEKTYGHQIRYTPRHSGGGSLRWEHRWVNLGASAMVVGHRYAYAQNNTGTLLPAYCDLGLSADRSFELGGGTFRVRVQVLNLLDTQYEVVKDYPMMGRNYRLAVTYEF